MRVGGLVVCMFFVEKMKDFNKIESNLCGGFQEILETSQ